MAKDPAFLFYTGDFTTGTQFMSDEQVGKYLRLLMAQHQHGRLSEKQVIFICKNYDKEVMLKFEKDESGFFFNSRLEKEISKRKAFSESRSNNKLGKKKNTSKSYDFHMEDENKNKDIIKEEKEKSKKFPFRELLVDYGFDEKLVDDWIRVRKNKKATNSETALKKFLAEIEKRTCNLNETMEVIVSKSWSGFDWAWMDNIKLNSNGNNKTGKQEKFAEYFKNKGRESRFSD